MCLYHMHEELYVLHVNVRVDYLIDLELNAPILASSDDEVRFCLLRQNQAQKNTWRSFTLQQLL